MDWLTPELLSIVLGFVVTYVTSFLKDCAWKVEYKTLLAGVISAGAAVLSLVVTGDVSWANFGTSLPIVFATATAFYNLHFKDTTTQKSLANKKVL